MVAFPTLYHPGPGPRASHNNLHTINAWPLFPEILTGKNPRSLLGYLQPDTASGPNLLAPPLYARPLDSQK